MSETAHRYFVRSRKPNRVLGNLAEQELGEGYPGYDNLSSMPLLKRMSIVKYKINQAVSGGEGDY